jgi:hypothetical protein
MKSDEYEKELKFLYRMAIKQEDVGVALDILERGRAIGLENMEESDQS